MTPQERKKIESGLHAVSIIDGDGRPPIKITSAMQLTELFKQGYVFAAPYNPEIDSTVRMPLKFSFALNENP